MASTIIRWVAPSPSEAMRRAMSMQMSSSRAAKAALSSSVSMATPEAPLAKRNRESLVEVSPSTVSMWKLLSAAAFSRGWRTAASTLASVVT